MDITNSSSTKVGEKRQRVKYHHANPLFDSWLQEWQEQAKKADSNTRFIFSKARQSLNLFPLPVHCGDDCKIVLNFGDKICSMIDRRLAKYEQEHGPVDWDIHIKAERSKPKRVRISSKSRPIESASSPLVCTVEDSSSGVNIEVHPRVTSTTTSSATTTTTASAATTAAVSTTAVAAAASKSGATKRRPRPRLKRAAVEAAAAAPSVVTTANHTSPTSEDSEHRVLFTLPGSAYDVLLCVDCAETTSKSSKDGIVKELSQNGIVHDVRKLHVGDFAWVARERLQDGAKKCREVILPYIVERKRMDDLAGSIKDGRCREQKHRLQLCGIQATIYLVEETGSKHAGLPLSTCHQAIANTNVVDGMLVKWAKDFRETAAFLTLMTRNIRDTYEGQSIDVLHGCRLPKPCSPGSRTLVQFSSFNNSQVKNRQLSVREMLAKHLLQIAGLSVQKVAAIVQEVQTPAGLLMLLSEPGGVARLADLRGSRTGRPVGLAAAAVVQTLYTSATLY